MKITKQEREEALAQLRGWLKPGDTVYTILRHVSRSGMQREIGLCVPLKGGDGKEPTFIHPNYSASRVLGERQGKRDGLIVGGCGMDMGFHLVYNLGYNLFPQGFGELGEREVNGVKERRRPATPEEAAQMVAEGWQFFGRNGDRSGWDSDGGYALRHRWL